VHTLLGSEWPEVGHVHTNGKEIPKFMLRSDLKKEERTWLLRTENQLSTD
jgi:hypothetical protein